MSRLRRPIPNGPAKPDSTIPNSSFLIHKEGDPMVLNVCVPPLEDQERQSRLDQVLSCALAYREVRVVRRAEEGEELTTLDGQVRKLNANHLVIADETRAVGLSLIHI